MLGSPKFLQWVDSMFVVRWILGRIILLLNFIFTPRGIKRSAQQQQDVDQACEKLALYQFAACPFCVKVRRQMKRLSLTIETKDAKTSAIAAELQQHASRVKVPCLRIESANGDVQWMFESSDINDYLSSTFSAEPQVCQG